MNTEDRCLMTQSHRVQVMQILHRCYEGFWIFVVSQGNILLCGFRNGVISTVDLRLPPPKESGLHFKSHVSVGGGTSRNQPNRRGKTSNVKQQKHPGGRVGGTYVNVYLLSPFSVHEVRLLWMMAVNVSCQTCEWDAVNVLRQCCVYFRH
jgi:hypothetical protein